MDISEKSRKLFKSAYNIIPYAAKSFKFPKIALVRLKPEHVRHEEMTTAKLAAFILTQRTEFASVSHIHAEPTHAVITIFVSHAVGTYCIDHIIIEIIQLIHTSGTENHYQAAARS